jgi:hypothetical protein
MAEIITPTYVGPLSLITPAASPSGQTSPATWLVVLSGMAVADFTGVSGTEYTILVLPDVTGPINTAVSSYGARSQLETRGTSTLNNGHRTQRSAQSSTRTVGLMGDLMSAPGCPIRSPR